MSCHPFASVASVSTSTLICNEVPRIQRTAAGCISVLCQLRSIRKSVQSTVYSLVATLVLPRLDYGNATLAEMPDCQLCRLQSVLNATARSVTGIRRNDHIIDALRNLHWFRVPERINSTSNWRHSPTTPCMLWPYILVGRPTSCRWCFITVAPAVVLNQPAVCLSCQTGDCRRSGVSRSYGPRVCNSLPADVNLLCRYSSSGGD